MAPGGFKARKKTTLAVPPVSRVTRGRKSLPPSEVTSTGPADESVGNYDEQTHPLHEGKFL